MKDFLTKTTFASAASFRYREYPGSVEIVFGRVDQNLPYIQTLGSYDLRDMAAFLNDQANRIEGNIKKTRSKTPLGPQHRTILDHLRAKGSITNVEANAVHRIRSLPRRILDLKEAGYEIKAEMKKDPTGQRYVRYSLAA